VAGPAGTDAETVFITRHEMTIEISNGRYEAKNGVVVLWRRNTCASVGTADSCSAHIADATHNSVENVDEICVRGTDAPRRTGGTALKNNMQTNSSEQSSGSEECRFISPSYSVVLRLGLT
jgi:hypothetical protein